MGVEIRRLQFFSNHFCYLGTLLTTPCSHVGHIFRKRSPYKWSGGVNILRKNSIRLAEVWLDEYKVLKTFIEKYIVDFYLEILL